MHTGVGGMRESEKNRRRIISPSEDLCSDCGAQHESVANKLEEIFAKNGEMHKVKPKTLRHIKLIWFGVAVSAATLTSNRRLVFFSLSLFICCARIKQYVSLCAYVYAAAKHKQQTRIKSNISSSCTLKTYTHTKKTAQKNDEQLYLALISHFPTSNVLKSFCVLQNPWALASVHACFLFVFQIVFFCVTKVLTIASLPKTEDGSL